MLNTQALGETHFDGTLFHEGDDGVTVSISTPGGALYRGTRVGDPVRKT